MDPRQWIEVDESARDMLLRVAAERPLVLLPPLHRVPLRVGNIVEIVGPSPSGKSEILLQSAINCILPKEWGGFQFGGLERLVLFFDLDCRFDVLRLTHCLKHRIMEVLGSADNVIWESKVGSQNYDATNARTVPSSDELFLACMRRFLYIRCYDTFEFLAALKTMRHRIQKEIEAHGIGVHFLMIDSISAFYWMDRASQNMPQRGISRKNFSLQSMTEIVVQELHRLLEMRPMLLLATKATILGIGTPASDAQKSVGRCFVEDTLRIGNSSRETEKYLYREYMPSAWQLFVTHRILLRVSDEKFLVKEDATFPIHTSEWILPPLRIVDKFTIENVGIFMVP